MSCLFRTDSGHGCRVEQRARRLEHHGGSLLAAEAGDVDQPHQRFDPGRRADRDGQPPTVDLGMLAFQRLKGIEVPGDRASTAQRRTFAIGIQGQPK